MPFHFIILLTVFIYIVVVSKNYLFVTRYRNIITDTIAVPVDADMSYVRMSLINEMFDRFMFAVELKLKYEPLIVF